MNLLNQDVYLSECGECHCYVLCFCQYSRALCFITVIWSGMAAAVEAYCI